jgi:hypothetical protein
MLTPTIHLNGTSREALLRGFADAADAVRDALAAVQATYPNGRDFYPQGPGAITQAMTIRLLTGHISAETAYVVDDYPYGFRLRCQNRYWLEHNPTHGVRLMSQTSNPKKPGLVWNKPKASTYARFAGAMYLDEVGHVQWSGLTEYTDGAQAASWRDTYGAGTHPASAAIMNKWVAAKLAYDARKVAA